MNLEEFRSEQGPGGLEARGYVAETRAVGDDQPRIEGLGSVYGQTTRIGGFFFEWDEEVAEGAWKNTISRDGADIRSMFNHDTNRLLGRTTAGTLRLEDRKAGLLYDVDINADDPNAMSVHAQVARGDVSGASVWFRVTSEQWEEPTDDNGLEVPKRTITEAELFEVGPVTMPAFEQTTAEAASFRGLGVTRASLQAIGAGLSAAGVSSESKLACRANSFLADPDSIEAELRTLFARRPELRESVCNHPGQHAAAAAPSEGAPLPQLIEVRKRQLDLLRVG